MEYAEVLRNESRWTKTENGMSALNSTGNASLDLFGSIGALRDAEEVRIERLFAEAWKEDPLTAMRIVFYGRDVRGGLGERSTFRVLLRYMANHHAEELRRNIHLIGEYGRFDDLYSLIHTPLEEDMWQYMKWRIAKDIDSMDKGEPVSLLAKWIKTADASSKETRKLGIKTAIKTYGDVRAFKRIIKELRRYIDITERHMSVNDWEGIKYESVPSRAMMIYRKAFEKHDGERFRKYIGKAAKGETTIHSDTLYPYDIIERMTADSFTYNVREDGVLEAQWKALPNYVEEGTNCLVMADTSGSMWGRPLYSAIGLAIYFAERNVGAYHNLWMSFSGNPNFHELKGETLAQKVSSLDMNDWGANTNLCKAFLTILDLAVRNNVPPDEIPKSLIVISDMEIDGCADGNWEFYDYVSDLYKKAGYTIPNVVFWNVNSRHDIFHADSKRKGVQLVSGQSASTFKNLLGAIGMNPMEFMMKVIDSERYRPITI